MEPILNKIKRDYPDLVFKPGKTACWTPQNNTVFYGVPFDTTEVWSLLHELGHAISRHNSFDNDVDLLLKEVEAWEMAKQISHGYGVDIENGHIEDCLDSYREWLHKRSTCPRCKLKGIYKAADTYSCPNCQSEWQVANSQINRPYRKLK